MPALVAFNRRWQIGSDDLVFVFGGGLLARVSWLIALCIIFGVYHKDMKSCHASNTLEAFFIGVIIVSCVVIFNECAIIWLSMKGTIINTRPRRHIPYLLYIQMFLYIPEMCLSGLGVYWAFYKSKGCNSALTIPVQATVVFQWCILLAVLITVLMFFDPLGSSQVGYQDDVHDHLHEHKVTKLWERRCKLLCCCFAGGDQDYVNAISDIAQLFASELHGVDAVPSDVAVGLILLQQQQEDDKRTLLESGKAAIEGKPVDLSNPDQKVLICDAAYFMKYSLGSYGWPLYVFMNPCCGVFHFCGMIRCCSCCEPENHVTGDNCCMCNTAAVHLQAQIPEDNLFYISFHNKLYEIPFYVALDDEHKAVVISIRGTLSMRDTLTDMTGHCEQILDIEGMEDGMAHKGMHLTASFIKDQLINKSILQGAFDEVQRRDRGEYRLIIVGHSLGAGTASVLSVILKPLYPNLKCFAYSNPSVLNATATAHAEDYVTSVIIGNDVVPRMGVKNLSRLIQDLETVILNCNLPKYRVLMTGFWRALCFFVGKKPSIKDSNIELANITGDFSPYDLTEPLLGERRPLTADYACVDGSYVIEEGGATSGVGNSNGRSEEPSTSRNGCTLVQLYPAGRILQINKDRNRPHDYELLWTDKEMYNRVLIHPRMLRDHFPDVVMKVLKNISSRA